MKSDLERAIAVIADLCGAGRPAVKESAEELAAWAEEFTDRYFDQRKPISCERPRKADDGYLSCRSCGVVWQHDSSYPDWLPASCLQRGLSHIHEVRQVTSPLSSHQGNSR